MARAVQQHWSELFKEIGRVLWKTGYTLLYCDTVILAKIKNAFVEQDFCSSKLNKI